MRDGIDMTGATWDSITAWGSMVRAYIEWVGTCVNLTAGISFTAFASIWTCCVMVASYAPTTDDYIVLVAGTSALEFCWDLTSLTISSNITTFLYSVALFVIATIWAKL